MTVKSNLNPHGRNHGLLQSIASNVAKQNILLVRRHVDVLFRYSCVQPAVRTTQITVKQCSVSRRRASSCTSCTHKTVMPGAKGADKTLSCRSRSLGAVWSQMWHVLSLSGPCFYHCHMFCHIRHQNCRNHACLELLTKVLLAGQQSDPKHWQRRCSHPCSSTALCQQHCTSSHSHRV